jgi:hypothetical protein
LTPPPGGVLLRSAEAASVGSAAHHPNVEDCIMNKIVAAAAMAALGLTAGSAQAADSRVQVGVLTCDVEPGVGVLIGSSKALTCEFERKGHRTETYSGQID